MVPNAASSTGGQKGKRSEQNKITPHPGSHCVYKRLDLRVDGRAFCDSMMKTSNKKTSKEQHPEACKSNVPK